MRVSSGTSSIQMLKAQQAWEARRAAKPASAPEIQQAAPARKIEAPVQPVTAVTTPSGMSPQWESTVREVQDIASKAGYIGVTEQDIKQAYLRGESLLADYRV